MNEKRTVGVEVMSDNEVGCIYCGAKTVASNCHKSGWKVWRVLSPDVSGPDKIGFTCPECSKNIPERV